MTKEKVVELVVKFWSNTLEFQTACSNGANDQANMLSNALATLIKMQNMVYDQDKLAKFREILTDKINKELEYRKWLPIHVDYHPDIILQDSAIAAGIKVTPLATFPFKTSTAIENMGVDNWVATVTNGYGAQRLELKDEDFDSKGRYVR